MRTTLFVTLLCGALVHAAGDPGAWNVAQEERFLTSARITSIADAGKGINASKKATLSDGRRTHAAHIQTIDLYMPLFKGKDGSEEKDFKDSWKFNVAAYRLACLLRLTNMVPVAVVRPLDGKPASFDWWVDGVAMDEKERLQKRISPPDVAAWNQQMDTIRIFDQLIYNMDRSQENLLITKDWKVWMIDHTRSFRKWPNLRNPAAITHCNPDLYRALKDLRRRDVAREIGEFVTADEIDALMARRDLIVQKLRP
jgi:hypothetical protein